MFTDRHHGRRHDDRIRQGRQNFRRGRGRAARPFCRGQGCRLGVGDLCLGLGRRLDRRLALIATALASICSWGIFDRDWNRRNR
jgi:hypothetical protein